ncbi:MULTISPECIES: hypothetical protein [unclassified Rickettsia]
MARIFDVIPCSLMSFPRRRESRKKHFLGHPEFISGYCSIDAETSSA